MQHCFPSIGGCAVGAHSVSVPFATLDADKDKITISFKSGSHTFPSSQVLKVAHFPGMRMQGLEIVHNGDGLPRPAIFWSANPDEVRKGLRELGYKAPDPDQ